MVKHYFFRKACFLSLKGYIFDLLRTTVITITKFITSIWLLVFSAAVFAVCPCDHAESSEAAIKTRHCHCSKKIKSRNCCSKKDSSHNCGCEKKIVKFNHQVKRITEQKSFALKIQEAITCRHFAQPEKAAVTGVTSVYYGNQPLCTAHHPCYYILYGALLI